ncbi:hypothetical protein EUTSA_v10002388mg [Eutrema salsugineum]|uniref:non-specific serine/threonine protein kinase n=1 Tax=Eutrema salsugineum TaxID=72664 RepID=V4L5H5_EUTSA|nr:hypothetical protein EUTSA_v10002388mg [Eutrema salsugineum]
MRLFLLFSFSAFMLLEAYRFTDKTDKKALLEFKSQVSEDKRVVLSSWNNSFPLCDWKGVTCGRKHKRVNGLVLGGFQLGGVISPSIGNLSFLIYLNLSRNSFGGTIPQEVGNLFRLRGIPINLFNCSRLLILYLYSNRLERSVPSELGSLTNLVDLHLGENNLNSKLPASLGNLTSLKQVSFGDNNLEGEIPDDISRLTQMITLELGTNKFAGVFPPPIYNLSSLEYLGTANCHFSGSLRHDFGMLLPNLRELSLGHNYFRGAIPTTLSNITNLQRLGIQNNSLTGGIPQSFGKLQNLQLLLLYSNSLGRYLSVSENRLGGPMPTSVVNLSRNLHDLDLRTNFISGNIPHDIGNLISMRRLVLEENKLTGILPISIGKLLQLGVLYLNYNSMSGEIPSSIGNITRLEELYLFNNRFEGTIPLSLSNCTSLRELNIGSNKLDGTIPREIMQIQSLVELNMLGRLEHLVKLSVSHNKLSGELPPSLGNCLSMEVLWLDGNDFHGAVPDIRGLKGLVSADFSNNSFVRSIPAYLADFSSLEYLNLSVNNFEGSVPTKEKFRNSSIVSVFGNKNLCGGIKELKLMPCFSGAPPMGSHHFSLLKKVVIGFSGGIALLLLLFVALVSLCWFKKRKKNQHTNNQTPSTSEVFHEKISYGEIRNATDGFSSSNMIGSGSFGTVYKAFLLGENNVVAVKVLNMQRRGAMKSFMAECESLKDIRHRNLVKLLTACSSIDFQGNEFRAFIYEFMPNGSLDMWLHPEEVEEIRRPSRTLTLFERLNVAIDVASVLDYLHVHCHEPIAHCDMKPSNVLLDNDLTAHVSGFGLARLLLKFYQESFFNQLSSGGVRGTIGYAAPEYGMGGQPSIHGDVYSFGVLLLEMFTGKRPTNELFGGNLTLYSFTKSALPERVLDIADGSILHNGGFPVAECLALVLEVGLRCCEESPTNRLETSEATKELISIRERFFKARRTARR